MQPMPLSCSLSAACLIVAFFVLFQCLTQYVRDIPLRQSMNSLKRQPLFSINSFFLFSTIPLELLTVYLPGESCLALISESIHHCFWNMKNFILTAPKCTAVIISVPVVMGLWWILWLNFPINSSLKVFAAFKFLHFHFQMSRPECECLNATLKTVYICKK